MVEIECPPDKFILDAAEEQGVALPFGEWAGVCTRAVLSHATTTHHALRTMYHAPPTTYYQTAASALASRAPRGWVRRTSTMWITRSNSF